MRSGHAAAVHSTLATRQYGSIYDVGRFLYENESGSLKVELGKSNWEKVYIEKS